ncbi:MAG: hypothetical protein AAFN05_07275 [Pseudomonadota bacterium]
MPNFPIDFDFPPDRFVPDEDLIPQIPRELLRRATLKQTLETGRVRGFSALLNEGCERSDILHLASMGYSDGEGRWALKLRTVLCYDIASFGMPCIVATPTMAENPVVISVGFILSGMDQELELTASLRTPDGAPVGEAPFHWHCVVPVTLRLI